jgi:predicted permease
MRLSLGAGRGRILRQLLTESALLAVFAGVAGLLVLRWTAGVIFTTFTEASPQLSPRWPTIAMTLIIAAGTGVVFGLLPALHATRANLADAIKDSVAGHDRHRSRLQRAFVIAEVALSMSLVSATGLLVHAVQTQAGPGVEAHDVSSDVYIADFDFRIANYTAARADELLGSMQSRVSAFPGVEIATFATGTPFNAWGAGAGRLVGDSATRESWQARRVYTVGPSYFEALGIDVERGRGVADTDVAGALPIAIVSTALASRLWRGENALGRVLTFEVGNPRSPSPLSAHGWTIVGVVKDGVAAETEYERQEIIYLSRRQFPFADNAQLIVRARSGSPDLSSQLTDEFRALAPDVPHSAVRTTRQLYSESNAEVLQVGLGASLAGVFALSLACVGVYAVIAFGIAQREREIGIRIALGAARSQVVGLFFRDGMRLVLIGFLIGVPLAVAGMKLLGTQMYGLTMVTPRPVLTVIAVLLGVAALASWLPARRATRVDPIDSLRSE